MWVVGAAVAVLGACDKGDGSSSAGTGHVKAAGGDELALFRDLPKGNSALFGGNLIKMQKQFADSPLGKLAAQVNKMTPGMDEWQTCFINGPGLRMVGGVTYAAGAVEAHYAMTGLDIASLEACAKKASFPAIVDADRKFITIDTNTQTGIVKSGFLVLPDGALLSRMEIPLGGFRTGAVVVNATDRASLEREVAALASGTAADDTALMAAVDKVDRSKALWVVGSGAGTPIADKLGLASATFEMTDGFTIDVTAELTDSALADQLDKGLAGAKKQAGQLGPEIGEIVNNVSFDRSGSKVHLTAKISNAQLMTLSEKLGPLMKH